MIVRHLAAVAVLIHLAACSRSEPQQQETAAENAAFSDSNDALAEMPAEPAAPGEPGGLADDRTPISEAPFEASSAQGAANVVQSYFALLESGRYAEARRLWSGGGEASGASEADFAARFRRYREYHAQIGAPGRIEGAAGSLYVEVPVQTYGRLANGEPFRRSGTVTLRRVNDVPGSTPAQRRWHIDRSDVEPA